MRHVTWLFVFLATAAGAAGSGGINSSEQRDKPYLLLISIDGFRWDYQDLYDTPTLDRVAANGVRAERMIPVFPTLTFPNHYSIATGLYPARHRLIGNSFPSRDRSRFYTLSDRSAVQDGSWYAGRPVWLAAEESGMVTAAYFFVGTEADIGGVNMTYWNQFDASIPAKERVEQALAWLSMPAESRPHLVTLYFEDVDLASHRYGPGSEESIAAIRRVDDYLETLLNGIEALPIADQVSIVIVSDHGQSAYVKDSPPFIIDEVASLDGLTTVDHGAAAFIYFPEPDRRLAEGLRDAINETWQHGKAMLRSDAPKAWHVTEAAGFADVIVQADPGYAVFSTRQRARNNSIGDHGWAPEAGEMHSIFLASGPRLPKGERIPPINAVDVYPLLMEILGLPITTAIDGNPQKLLPLLKP